MRFLYVEESGLHLNPNHVVSVQENFEYETVETGTLEHIVTTMSNGDTHEVHDLESAKSIINIVFCGEF